MSNCGRCGSSSSSSGCTCFFVGNATADLTGNGRSYAGFNFRPTNVPRPRPYGQLARQFSDQIVGAFVRTEVVFDSETFPGSMTSIVTAPTRLTAPISGYYLASWFVTSNGVDETLVMLKNGIQILEGQSGAAVGDRSAMTMIQMLATDYLELQITTVATPVTIVRTDPSPNPVLPVCYPHFWAQWVRPL